MGNGELAWHSMSRHVTTRLLAWQQGEGRGGTRRGRWSYPFVPGSWSDRNRSSRRVAPGGSGVLVLLLPRPRWVRLPGGSGQGRAGPRGIVGLSWADPGPVKMCQGGESGSGVGITTGGLRLCPPAGETGAGREGEELRDRDGVGEGAGRGTGCVRRGPGWEQPHSHSSTRWVPEPSPGAAIWGQLLSQSFLLTPRSPTGALSPWPLAPHLCPSPRRAGRTSGLHTWATDGFHVLSCLIPLPARGASSGMGHSCARQGQLRAVPTPSSPLVSGHLDAGSHRKALMKTGLILLIVGHLSFITGALVHGTVLRFVVTARDATSLHYGVTNSASVIAALLVPLAAGLGTRRGRAEGLG